MQEFIGLAYYTEIPAVFFDIQRTGPSTGMPTRTQQGDLFSLAYASHGDTKHIVIFPANPEECFYLSAQAFDIAERFQTPVFVASDLDIGMNDWMCKRLEWDDSYRPDRGKVLSAEDLEKVERFSRYLDVDGDGVAARTLPGVSPKGAYFVRGSGHDKFGAYTEDSAAYQEVVDRLAVKISNSATALPAPVIRNVIPSEARGATNGDVIPSEARSAESRNLHHPQLVGITSIGGCDAAVREAVDRLAEMGLHVDYMRIRAFPFGAQVKEFLDAHLLNFVVEQNRDAQLRAMIAIETGKPRDEMVPVLSYGGMPLTAQEVVTAVSSHMAQFHALKVTQTHRVHA
jgi:2-oxoglutarate ferredoxin oxidoreductase subunit alpha